MSNIFKKTYKVDGMTCKSCEVHIPSELIKVQGIKSVNVDYRKNSVTIESDGTINEKLVNEALKNIGYTLQTEKATLSTYIHGFLDLLIAGILLIILYQILKSLGILNLVLSTSTNYSNLVVVFLLGLTAGLSTCSGTISGIVLAIATKSHRNNLTFINKISPHIYFNLGRIVFFTIFGYILGLIGSSFHLSLQHIGLVTIISSIIMILLGFQILGFSSFIGKIVGFIPALLSKCRIPTLNKNFNSNVFILGGLTFFSPCGFTLGVQLFALSSANPIVGALSLGTFAIGTTPGLIGLSSLSFFIRKDESRILVRMIGLAVILLSFNSFINGFNLLGYQKISFNQFSSISNNILGVSDTNYSEESEPTSDTIQVLKAIYTNKDDMVPSNFSVKVGQKVRLEVDAKETGYGCMGSLALPSFTDKYEIFEEGKMVVFEFTPTQRGTYQITCAMGVPRGELIVI